MKKNCLSLIVCAFLLLVAFSSYAQQDWVEMMQNPNTNFYDVQKAFNKYYEKTKAEKGKEENSSNKSFESMSEEESEDQMEVPGYMLYKRWEWFMAPRVSATGERFAPDAAWKAMEKYKEQYDSRSIAGNWTMIGPSTVSGLAGAGRLCAVRVHPTDPNILFVCSPGGGLWKSTTGGTSWSTNTDWVSQVIGCSDIAIDPVSPNVMYLATGDGDHADTYSIGLLKSTDAGSTWNPSGLSFTMSQSRRISKILIHPTMTKTLILATSAGIYRSTDAGTTFTMVQSGSFKDMEFKPGDPNTVYASGTAFYKSTDNGVSWVKITSALPVNTSRIAIAVTAADATIVYLIIGLPSPNYGTEGFYQSTDAGTSFTKVSTPNIGTQQWYDLCVASSPTNKNEILLGGQTQFLKSTNGGATWASSGSGTHVDYHDIIYTSGTTVYLTSDGGVWKSTNSGSAWTNLNKGLSIAQMYGFGQSVTNANLNIQGWQDNGTARYNGTWSSIMGGDGMLCFISWKNDQNMWGSQYNGSLNKSTNGGTNFSACKGNITGTGAWVTPWIEDPVTANTIYTGFNDVWKHTSGGGTTGWTKISSFSGGGTLVNLAVSPADNKIIWATNGSALYKTSDGGITWTTITNQPAGTITYIACSKTNAKKAWITYSGFTSSNKVFQTNDQGATWVNLSGSLPNIPINCITVDKNGTDAIYIGTDVGVFYKDASLSVWQSFSTNLPNVVVTQLEIFYPGNKLRASTFGRGMWESDLYGVTTSIEKEEPAFITTLKTFPNPNDGHFNLEMTIANTNNYIIEIYNVIGELVYKENLNGFKGDYCKPFDLSTYGKGMYTLSVTNSENKSIKKIIIY